MYYLDFLRASRLLRRGPTAVSLVADGSGVRETPSLPVRGLTILWPYFFTSLISSVFHIFTV